MADTKNLCAQIPLALYQKVYESKEQSGLTLNQYVTLLITEYYELKEMRSTMTQTRTLAVQISEELFTRIKKYVEKTPHLTQKALITELITKALDELEKQEIRM